MNNSHYQRGTLATSGAGGGSVTTPITLPGTDSQRSYDLDHLGNWKKTTYKPVPALDESSSSSSGSADIDTLETDRRDHNALNQITRRKASNSSSWDIFSYDLNGNLLDDGERLMAYDAFNRLVQVKRKSDDAVIGEYTYDAGGHMTDGDVD